MANDTVKENKAAQHLKKYLLYMRPALEASLDPVAVVDSTGTIVFSNPAMRIFLRSGQRKSRMHQKFCERVKLAICQPKCQLMRILQKPDIVRVDETPAVIGAEKMRVSVKMVPIVDPDVSDTAIIVGAVVSVRETTGEILVQAKYKKTLKLLQDKDAEILALKGSRR